MLTQINAGMAISAILYSKGKTHVGFNHRRHFPHLVAGSIMVGMMAVMFCLHRWRGALHKPQDALEVLKLRFARGEISREEYEDGRKLIAG